MPRKERRVGPLSRLEPIKKCSSISCLTPGKSSGKSLIHDKFKRNLNDEQNIENDESDSLLFPAITYKTKTPSK